MTDETIDPARENLTDSEHTSEMADIRREPLPAAETDAAVADGRLPRIPRVFHPWLQSLLPFILLIATGVVIWISTHAGMNGITLWQAWEANNPGFLPAAWIINLWWLTLVLLGAFLIYGSLPQGREVSSLHITGPLLELVLIILISWIFCQHWGWDLAGLICAGIILLEGAVLVTLFFREPAGITLPVYILLHVPAGFLLGLSLWLTAISLQQVGMASWSPGGTVSLLIFLILLISAILALILHKPVPAAFSTVWMIALAQQQFGQHNLVGVLAVLGAIIAGVLAVVGGILATESRRTPAFAGTSSKGRRISFLRRSNVTGE